VNLRAWLHIVGIGEDGLAGLTAVTRSIVEEAEIIIGGDRHHKLSNKIKAERLSWPSPFNALIEKLYALKGRKVVVLATGDPLWFSVGARISKNFKSSELIFHPHISAFQMASARMGWSLADVETLTTHGRPVEQIIPFIQPNQKLIILTTGSKTPLEVARLLNDRGFEKSEMTVVSSLGGAGEKRFDGLSAEWVYEVPDFNTLMVNCIASSGAAINSRLPGLDDSLFKNDGNMTKREIRAVTLSKLMPMRGALLWDVGSGCGSVSIEWMRAVYDGRAIGIEPKLERRLIALENALALGTPRLRLVDGMAPGALKGLEDPDAVFIGGGLTKETFEICWNALKPFGRLVVNAVSVETEVELSCLHNRYGGELVRLAVNRAEPIGSRLAWRPFMPVTQWSIIKR